MTEHVTMELTPEELRRLIREELELVLDAQERLKKEWYKLGEAAQLKGVSPDVLRKQPRRYWPAFGRSHPVVSKGHYSQMYHRSEVALWLPLTEAEIDELWQQRRNAS